MSLLHGLPNTFCAGRHWNMNLTDLRRATERGSLAMINRDDPNDDIHPRFYILGRMPIGRIDFSLYDQALMTRIKKFHLKSPS
jgi:hypothetical protein